MMLREELGPLPQDPAPAVGRTNVAFPPASGLADDRFVGRQDELTTLRSALGAASVETGSLILVSGEPGIGKTRLAVEASLEARSRNFRVVWGRCWEAGGAPPYWPWVEVLRQILGAKGRPSDDLLGRHAAQLARLVPEAFAHVEPAAAPADPESGRFLLFDAVATLLRISSAQRPLLVVVDDFHAADRVSVLLLVFVARALRAARVVVVATCRDAEARATPELADALGELTRDASRLTLGGLGAGDVLSMLERPDGSRPGDTIVARIHRVTEGNPFFVREIARLLPRDASSDRSLTAFRIPDGIRDIVRRRLLQLPDATRSLLAIAAVAGREFDTVVVSRAAGIDMLSLLERIEPAGTHGIVAAVPGEPGRFSFRHTLIQETICEDLAPAVRIQLHKDIRDALEQISAMAPDRYVAELAHHALAAAPACGDDRFIEHATRAARAAMQRMAFEEAVELYQRTLDSLVHASPDERRRCELLLALGEAMEWSSDARGSRGVIELAASVARALPAPDLLARAALAVGGIEALKSTASSRCETATSLLHEALGCTHPNDLGLRARLRSRLALHSLTNGAVGDALGQSATAVLEARTCNDKGVLAHALIARHAVLYGPDHLPERCTIAAELCTLAQELDSREFAMRAQALRVVNALERGDLATVDVATALHARLADTTQDPFERWANVVWRATRALLVGRLDDATTLAHEAFAMTHGVPGLHTLEINGPAVYLGQLVLIEDTRFGTPPELALTADPSSRFGDIVVWRMAKLHALTRLGRAGEAQAELDTVVDDLLSREPWETWLAAMSYVAEAIALVGDRLRAAEVYPRLLPYAGHNVTLSFAACRGSLSRFLGLLAVTLGQHDTAARHFEDALALNQRMHARPHVAATLYEYAATLLGNGAQGNDFERAFTMCREALGIARDLRMPGLEVRCEELLATHARKEPPAGTPPDHFELIARGSFWTLSHAGTEVVVKDRKGVRYIAELLRNPDRDVHSRDLVAVFRTSSATSFITVAAAEPLDQSGAHTGDFSEPLVDPASRRAYARRLDELDEELSAAASAGDPERLAVLREEHRALEREMARITGLGGRARRSDDTERIRVAVTRAIRNALAEIASVDPNVGSVLARRIRTGTYCRYSPDPRVH